LGSLWVWALVSKMIGPDISDPDGMLVFGRI